MNFVYALDQKLAKENHVGAYAIGEDEDGYGLVERDAKITEQADGTYAPFRLTDLIEFYTINSKGVTTLIDEDYADYNIYAGYVTVAQDVDYRDYVQVALLNGGKIVDFYTNTIPTYAVTFNAKAAATVDTIWVNDRVCDPQRQRPHHLRCNRL